MEEIYCITRLDGVLETINVALFVFGITFVFCGFGMFIKKMDEEKCPIPLKKGFKISIIALISLAVIRIFIPTNKELLAIYGIGGTIDYIKSDSVATNLPSKAIKAIDLWLDEKTNE